MEYDRHWRRTLKLYLSERIGQSPLSAGELFDRIGTTMPLYNATRFWACHSRRHVGAPERSAIAMRWMTFSAYLRSLTVRFDPAVGCGTRRSLKRTTIVIVEPLSCATCGRNFVTKKKRRFCCRYCAAAQRKGKAFGNGIKRALRPILAEAAE